MRITEKKEAEYPRGAPSDALHYEIMQVHQFYSCVEKTLRCVVGLFFFFYCRFFFFGLFLFLINFAAVGDDEFSASLRGCACFRRCGVRRSKQM